MCVGSFEETIETQKKTVCEKVKLAGEVSSQLYYSIDEERKKHICVIQFYFVYDPRGSVLNGELEQSMNQGKPGSLVLRKSKKVKGSWKWCKYGPETHLFP